MAPLLELRRIVEPQVWQRGTHPTDRTLPEARLAGDGAIRVIRATQRAQDQSSSGVWCSSL
jgi:hypothetical protein